MRQWIRRIRGILGTGLTWGLGGLTVGAVLGSVLAVLLGTPFEFYRYGAILGMAFGGTAAVLGVGFATVFAVLEGRHSLSELSPFRSAFSGALVGIAAPVAFVLLDPSLRLAEVWDNVYMASVFLGSLASVAAAATVLIAQRTQEQIPGSSSHEALRHRRQAPPLPPTVE